MTTRPNENPTDAPALVVFGRDEAGKAHASWFDQGDAKLAKKAAELMGLRVLAISTEAERALAAKVPKGRVFGSGKAFVPFVKAGLFLELQTAALNSGVKPLKLVTGPTAGEVGEPSPAPPEPTPSKKASKANGSGPVKQPCGWADIQVGAIVLASAPPKYFEWYECRVLAVEGEDSFTLRYCDWPDEPTFVRRRVQLGLMHPAHQPEPPLEPEPSLEAA
jgi:hypothetical protein